MFISPESQNGKRLARVGILSKHSDALCRKITSLATGLACDRVVMLLPWPGFYYSGEKDRCTTRNLGTSF